MRWFGAQGGETGRGSVLNLLNLEWRGKEGRSQWAAVTLTGAAAQTAQTASFYEAADERSQR